MQNNIASFNFFRYSTMCKCWKLAPDDRPSFENLSALLERRLQTLAGYLDLAMPDQLEDTVSTV